MLWIRLPHSFKSFTQILDVEKSVKTDKKRTAGQEDTDGSRCLDMQKKYTQIFPRRIKLNDYGSRFQEKADSGVWENIKAGGSSWREDIWTCPEMA